MADMTGQLKIRLPKNEYRILTWQDCHMNKLIKFDPITQPSMKKNDFEKKKKKYSTIESNVGALRGLGINYEYFEPLLVPITSKKLPNTINLPISR